MSSFRGSLIASLADLAVAQILDVMHYIESRGRRLGRMQRECLRALEVASVREAIAITGLTAEQCRDAAVRMLMLRQSRLTGEVLTQVIEGGYLRIGSANRPYEWSGPRLVVAGHQFLVRELLAARPAPAAALVVRPAMPVQLDLFEVAA